MSTELRNVPDCVAQNELTQTRFWGGKDRMTCIQITQVKPKHERTTSGSADFFNHLSLTRHQARMLAVELMLFAEGQEVCEFETQEEEV
jgi:hypothetical protein